MRNGYRARCRLDEFVGFVEVFANGAYDLPDVRWADLRTIVDVGANVGAATLWFAQRAPQAKIVAVEPASRANTVLAHNVRANHLETRVGIVAAALAQRSGSVVLEQSGPSVHTRIAQGSSRGERVSALSLEELLGQCRLEEIDLLKLDCEGAEFGILMSSADRLLRRIGAIVGEYHVGDQHPADWADLKGLLAHLENAGFKTRTWGEDPLGLFQAIRI
jgi:FkbM family methyltransferase